MSQFVIVLTVVRGSTRALDYYWHFLEFFVLLPNPLEVVRVFAGESERNIVTDLLRLGRRAEPWSKAFQSYDA